MTVGKSFDKSVANYDGWMKMAIPSYDLVFSTAIELIPYETNHAIQVMDLGAGTGLFSQQILTVYPLAEFLLVDLATKMLDVARQRFRQNSNQFEYRVEDIRNLQTEKQVDLVISSLSIHHLADHEKLALFKQVFRSLKSGGVFINIDQVKGPTPALEDLYWKDWLEKIRGRGAPEGLIEASIQRRQEFDQDALLVDQLQWLTDAGFNHVDCVFKDYFIGVFYAVKD